MLKAHSIYKSYGQLKILKGVDIEVKRGEIVTIVGASGAGKSTLANHLISLLRKEGKTVGVIAIDSLFAVIANGFGKRTSFNYRRRPWRR